MSTKMQGYKIELLLSTVSIDMNPIIISLPANRPPFTYNKSKSLTKDINEEIQCVRNRGNELFEVFSVDLGYDKVVYSDYIRQLSDVMEFYKFKIDKSIRDNLAELCNDFEKTYGYVPEFLKSKQFKAVPVISEKKDALRLFNNITTMNPKSCKDLFIDILTSCRLYVMGETGLLETPFVVRLVEK